MYSLMLELDSVFRSSKIYAILWKLLEKQPDL